MNLTVSLPILILGPEMNFLAAVCFSRYLLHFLVVYLQIKVYLVAQ